MNEEDAIKAFDGIILSDGHIKMIGKYSVANFSINLSDNKTSLKHRDNIPLNNLLLFLTHIKTEILKPLGIEVCTGHPKIEYYTDKESGRVLPWVYLETRSSIFLAEQHDRYYPNGTKQIPKDWALSDISLSYFFMGDGSSSWSSSGGAGIKITLCTQGFDTSSVELLESQLHQKGVNTGRGYTEVENGAGIIITIPADSTDIFMGIVDKYVIVPYRYKIKYRGSGPTEILEKSRLHFNGLQRLSKKKRFSDTETRLRYNMTHREWAAGWRANNREHVNEYHRTYAKAQKLEKQRKADEDKLTSWVGGLKAKLLV